MTNHTYNNGKSVHSIEHTKLIIENKILLWNQNS